MNGLYEKLLEGRLEPEEHAQLVAGLNGDDGALDTILGDVDPAERELLLRPTSVSSVLPIPLFHLLSYGNISS